MAKRRTSLIKVDTEAVQGEDSWVKVRRLTVGEQRDFMHKIKSKEIDTFEIGVQLLKQNVHSWDWVNDDGEPLAQPFEDPSVIELLTDDEVVLLGKAIRGTDTEELKNSESKSPSSSG